MTINSSSKIVIEGLNTIIRSLPVQGITGITSYTDDSASSSMSGTWSKTFRYSKNGIVYSDYIPLTTPALTGLTFVATDIVVFEIVFHANQPDGADYLTVSDFSMSATAATPATALSSHYDKSIFKKYFESNSTQVLQWQINVLEKLYENGIIPSYILRTNFEDYYQFWSAITKFFAYYVTYARVYKEFETYLDILSEFLTQRGLSVSITNDLGELQTLMESFNTQMLYRGTAKIIDKKEDGAAIDGELIRLIFFDSTSDEFVFNAYKPQYFGWNVGNCSPLYRSIFLNDSANKYWNKSFGIESLSLIPHTGNVSVVTDSTVALDVLQMSLPAAVTGKYSGKTLKISTLIDYEITFIIKTDNTGNKLRFGVSSFDSGGSNVMNISSQDGSSTNNFLNGQVICTYGNYAVVRGVIYSQATAPSSLHKTQTHQGNDLIFNTSTVAITPIISMIDGNPIRVYGIRVMPLLTPYSRGFVQVKSFISCWLRNHNKQYSNIGLQEYVKRFLIPYNSTISITFIEQPDEQVNPTNPIERIFDSGDDLDHFTSPWIVGKSIALAIDGIVQSTDQYSFDIITGTVTPVIPFEVGQRMVIIIVSENNREYRVTGSGDTASWTPAVSIINKKFAFCLDGFVQSSDQYTYDNTTGTITPTNAFETGQRLSVIIVKNIVTSNPIEYTIIGSGDQTQFVDLTLIGQQATYALDGYIQCSIDQYTFDKILGRITPSNQWEVNQKLVTLVI